MDIRKDSFLYRVAYFHKDEESPQPIVTNLCLFFWRFVFYFPIVSGIVLPAYFVGLLFGRYPDFEGLPFASHPYNRWPKIRGYRILPIVVLLVGFVIYLSVLTIANDYWGIWIFLFSNYVLFVAIAIATNKT